MNSNKNVSIPYKFDEIHITYIVYEDNEYWTNDMGITETAEKVWVPWPGKVPDPHGLIDFIFSGEL
jgi:hypothetical protein